MRDVPARWWAREADAPWRGADLAGARRAARALRALRPDVVVSGSLVHPAGALAAAVLRVPHVWWVQEFATADHGYRLPLGERGRCASSARSPPASSS